MSLSAYNRQRGTTKTKVGKITNFLKDFIITDEHDSYIILSEKLTVVKDIIKGIQDLKILYYGLPEETDLKDALDLTIDLEEEAEQIKVSLLLLLSKCKQKHENVDEVIPKSNIKLPDLPLPMFNGKFQEFELFKSQFMNIIGKNPSLNDTQKLCYLKSALKNDAALIQSDQDTFHSLMNALETRYENKRALVDIHIAEILSMNKIQYENSAQIRVLIDTCRSHIRSLKNLNLESNKLSDAIFLHILNSKVDKESQRLFQLSLNSTEVPSLQNFLSFLETRCIQLESSNKTEFSKNPPFKNKNTYHSNANYGSRSRNLLTKQKQDKVCIVANCKSFHPLYKCDKFKCLSFHQRKELIKNNNICERCLSYNHCVNCPSTYFCANCKGKNVSALHNILICEERISSKPKSIGNTDASDFAPETSVSMTCKQNNMCSSSKGLLNTAIIYVSGQNGRQALRCLLDSASENCFITLEAAKMIGLKKIKNNSVVQGLNNSVTNINYFAKAAVSNYNETFNLNVDFLITTEIIKEYPTTKLDFAKLSIPTGIILADEDFDKPSEISCLLGSEYFFDIFGPNQIEIPYSTLKLVESKFGFVVAGSYKENQDSLNHCFLSKGLNNLDKTLCSFWETENNFDEKPIINDELSYCEEHFKRTHVRKPCGRYSVSLPFKKNIPENVNLGNSRSIASKRLNQLWARLDREPKLKMLYTEFIDEYIALGHMEEVADLNEIVSDEGYFLPHHGVLRKGNCSRPLRVVFNGSQKTDLNISLNDVLYKGGIIQDDLFTIMLRARKHPFFFSCDISHMFRQIEINPEQRHFQKILWKKGCDEPVQIYKLKTVTYGTTPACFLSTRVLQQLANDERDNFPNAAQVVLNDVYLDDILSGCPSLKDLEILKTELINLFKSGGMSLHKWCFSHTNDDVSNLKFDEFSEEHTVKTLGILWNGSSDTFCYKVSLPSNYIFTKRDVLSQIARLFDPLGLLGPVISKAKFFMQQLWLLKLDWGEQLPKAVAKEWASFVQSLPALERLKIPRFVFSENPGNIMLLGYCDASEKGFGAVIYATVVSNDKIIHSQLLCSKSRVAPLKTLTVPRLELSACLLLAKLITKVITALKMNISHVKLFSDSTIALSWIKTPPHQLKTFVANRVAKIQDLTLNFSWHHIVSNLNSADLLSRGLNSSELLNCDLWWKGPDLSKIVTNEPSCNIKDYEFEKEFKNPEAKSLVLAADVEFLNKIISITHNFCKLIRIVSFIFRFIKNTKTPRNLRVTGHLSLKEINDAEIWILKKVQSTEFSKEIISLKNGNSIPSKSKLVSLNCFVDNDNIIRVGGRLQNSSLSLNAKNPIILPSKHVITTMIIHYYHLKFLHVGPNNLLYHVRRKYWPLNGRNLARQVVHNCTICFKNQPILANQIMGNLPKERVTPSFPFNNCGVDFCGPFNVKFKNQRKGILNKVYVSIFVCLSTKAIHLDFVSDLTSNAFIACLKRFFGKRGKWRFEKNNVEIGTLVLIKNDTLPSTKWLTGRITEIIVGNDNKIRVVNIKLPNHKIIKRNVRDICILPVEQNVNG